MRSTPDEVDQDALVRLVVEGWGVDVDRFEYAAVGGGSYHWVVTGVDGARAFVTVDDLERKPWLGETSDEVFDGLSGAFDVATALRAGGLDFVVAPVSARSGTSCLRLTARWSVALFPFVSGRAGAFGRYTTGDRRAVVDMLAQLHRGTAFATAARPINVAISGRAAFEATLQELERPWSSGPLAEPARGLLSEHADAIAALLGRADRAAAAIAAGRGGWVVTHGEPHAANVLRAGGKYVLIDWDTVALGPIERDLWMLTDGGADAVARYAAITGSTPDQIALDYFGLRWDLEDIAGFTEVLCAPHRETADTTGALASLEQCLADSRRWLTRLE